MLQFLFSPFTALGKCGPKLSEFLENLSGGKRIVDLLYHQPVNVVVKSYLPKLYEVQDGQTIIAKVKVETYIKPAIPKHPFKIQCFSPSGYLTIILFKIFPGYVEQRFPLNQEIAVSGKVEKFNGGTQIVHPDYVLPIKLIDQIPKNEVIYPLTYGINQKFLRTRINEILHKTPEIPEWIDETILKKNSWVSWKKSMNLLHNPQNLQQINPQNPARRRLAYDELLASQIARQIARKQIENQTGHKIIIDQKIQKQILKKLPFELTEGQKKVLTQIEDDLQSDKKMLRLLQGDVGSGKTIIAFLSAVQAVINQKQAAIIVPIALLAEQHFENFQKLLKDFNFNIAILTAKTTKKQKAQILKDLKSGQIQIIIGTHALIYQDVIFKDLGLIIIDEQHRFGVLQRLELIKKGQNPDVLLMSATPIPRSLMMTLYSDMDISILDQKPINRLEIDTRVLSLSRLEEINQAMNRAVKNGEKIYWICPLIEESEELDFSNVTMRYELFRQQFGDEKVALIHGKMKDQQKDQIMEKFTDPKSSVQILISTTVIEVGIDVKDASIMIVENCERFGLSQLHQLRGRVGRGDKKSFCLLLYGPAISETGKKRLEIMRSTNDGFKIAEEDLKMRGAGELLGVKQSGLPEYKIASLIYDNDLLAMSNKHAAFLLNKDPNLQGEIGQNLRLLLKLFGYDDCVKLIGGG